MTEEMAEHRSVWHTKIKAPPLLHGGCICEKSRCSQNVCFLLCVSVGCDNVNSYVDSSMQSFSTTYTLKPYPYIDTIVKANWPAPTHSPRREPSPVKKSPAKKSSVKTSQGKKSPVKTSPVKTSQVKTSPIKTSHITTSQVGNQPICKSVDRKCVFTLITQFPSAILDASSL